MKIFHIAQRASFLVLISLGILALQTPFALAATAPTVVTGNKDADDGTTVQLGFSITSVGSSHVNEYGIKYATAAYYTANGNTYSGVNNFTAVDVAASTGGDFFFGGLACGTVYHYQAYAINNDGLTGTGIDKTMTTLSCPAAPAATAATIQNSTPTSVDMVFTGSDFSKFVHSGGTSADATDLAGITYNGTHPTSATISNNTTLTATFPLSMGTGKSGGSATFAANTIKNRDNSFQNALITVVDGSITDSANPQLVSALVTDLHVLTVTYSEIVSNDNDTNYTNFTGDLAGKTITGQGNNVGTNHIFLTLSGASFGQNVSGTMNISNAVTDAGSLHYAGATNVAVGGHGFTVPTISITSPAASASYTSQTWAPVISWGDATSCFYRYNPGDSWTTVTACATNTIPVPSASGSATLFIEASDNGGTNFSTAQSSFTYSAGGGGIPISTNIPIAPTLAVRTVTATEAGLQFSALANSANTISSTGLEYSNDTSTTSSITLGAMAAAWNYQLSGLACGTTYSVRGYVANTMGKTYSPSVSFTTNACAVTTPTVSPTVSVSGGSSPHAAASSTPAQIQMPPAPAATNVTLPTRDLTLGSTGQDVYALQRFLNQHGFSFATSGNGSLGHETTTFGTLTRIELKAFQKANKITPASGYYGPATRAVLAKLGYL